MNAGNRIILNGASMVVSNGASASAATGFYVGDSGTAPRRRSRRQVLHLQRALHRLGRGGHRQLRRAGNAERHQRQHVHHYRGPALCGRLQRQLRSRSSTSTAPAEVHYQRRPLLPRRPAHELQRGPGAGRYRQRRGAERRRTCSQVRHTSCSIDGAGSTWTNTGSGVVVDNGAAVYVTAALRFPPEPWGGHRGEQHRQPPGDRRQPRQHAHRHQRRFVTLGTGSGSNATLRLVAGAGAAATPYTPILGGNVEQRNGRLPARRRHVEQRHRASSRRAPSPTHPGTAVVEHRRQSAGAVHRRQRQHARCELPGHLGHR